MHASLRRIHRWIGLTFLLFWVLQAASGLFLTFHREIDDWTSRGPAPTASTADTADLSRVLDRASELAESRGEEMTGIFSTTGYSSRFDVHLSDPDTGRPTTVRLDGRGRPIHERALDAPLLDGGIYLAVFRFHKQLLAGNTGGWIVGLSGIALLSNLLLGLKLAWPARGQWRKALVPKVSRSSMATVYGFHRAAGLWLAPVALVTVSCGVMLAFERGTASALGAAGDRPPLDTTGTARGTAPSAAAEAAVSAFPGSDFTGMQMPRDGFAYFTIFLRQPRELNQAYGATRVYVSAQSGSVDAAYDPLDAPAADRVMSALMPIHTGQAGGVPGRILVVAIGIWLIALVSLGASLWWLRRRKEAERSSQRRYA